MATTTLPRPSLPPSSPLPSIPVPKTRRRSSISSQHSLQAPSGTALPQPSRSPSARMRPGTVPHHIATSSLPKVPLNPAVVSNRQLRKTISIGSFPQPPIVGPRSSSQASSPVSSTSPINPLTPRTPGRRAVSQGTSLRRPPRTSSRATPSRNFTSGSATSLLNGGEGKSVSYLNLPSPPGSRASSAQDSYSTVDERDDIARGRHRSMDDVKSEADKQGKDSKGNVIVSVRVRPDAATNDGHKTELEWMVDGRRSLISYRGKEGGEYIYGEMILDLDLN